MKDHEISSDKVSSTVNALLIIDVQEKIIRPIFNKDLIIKNGKKLLYAYQILEENIFVSEQNPLKLGGTITELLPKAGFRKIEKMEFSLAKIEEFTKELKNKKVTNLIVCGIETHICIQQTVLDFLKKGFEVFLISDSMGSRNKADHEIALQRMTQKGAILTTTESIIFELCKTADRKEFKEIRNIIMS
ncbi:hydrolase [Prochlorococcus marinus XMU1411]|uniref:hydrolase n=1 Tax=Prochlorococcus marinus TaxID=1219 RepID=UPI001ADBF5AC|nr:hydrolase [Prochlorococcus marinus]MBO8243503.1 hydrolase [Prochlorococcus marinus XMU1411]MBW3054617.1 hydrolase [Prochlorococcus marinus str. MU1411]MCR8538196.1 hydrolase [Prochlorococcus marinus CUG1430]